MTTRFDAKDLARAVEAGILQPDQEQALQAFLSQRHSATGSLQLAHGAFYFGALLVMGAMGWLLNEAWLRIGDTALLAVASAYIGLLTLVALSLQKRKQPVAAGVLAAAAVSIVPLAVFALERLLGWWPLDDVQADYHQYYTQVQGGWLAMEAATVLAGVVMLRLVPYPFIVMPIAVALWFMSMDLTEWVVGAPFSWEQRREVSLWFGLATLLVCLLVDGRTRHDYAHWGYLAGLAAFWSGLTMLDSGSEWGKATYCLINLVLMGVAVLLRRPVFMVFGALGVAAYLGYLAYDVFAESLLFPVLVSLIGLGVIGLGLLYQKHREPLSQSVRSALPGWLYATLPALRH